MADPVTKLPVKTEEKTAPRVSAPEAWRPFESLRREVDRLFEDFDRGFWHLPSRRALFAGEPFLQQARTWSMAPAVDVSEKEKTYEIAVELPGIDEKDIEVKLSGGVLTIKGEKKEEKEEKRKDYHVSERRYGSFERSFQLPDGVDAEKIDATFKNGVLMVSLPKTAEAQKQEKKIAVKAA